MKKNISVIGGDLRSLTVASLLSKDDYDFLSHDSYISATNVVTLPRNVIVQSMHQGRTLVKGKLLDHHMNDILNKVRSSRLFSKITKDRFFY